MHPGNGRRETNEDNSTQRQGKAGHDAPKHGLLKIGEVSKHSGIGIETLRFYEKSGFLDRPARTRVATVCMTQTVLERLAFIKQAQVLGFSLEEIKRIIDDARAGQSPCDEVREIVRRRLDELDARIARDAPLSARTGRNTDRVGQSRPCARAYLAQ